MECIRPLSTLALSRLDIARMVQCRRDARRRDIPLLRPPTAWPSSSTSLQSFSRFMNRVKYLHTTKNNSSIRKDGFSIFLLYCAFFICIPSRGFTFSVTNFSYPSCKIITGSVLNVTVFGKNKNNKNQNQKVNVVRCIMYNSV